MCPFFISGVLKYHATAGTSERGFANGIKISELKKFPCKDMMCHMADNMIVRAKAVVDTNEDPVNKRAAIIACGGMECELVQYILATDPEGSMGDCNERFCRKVLGTPSRATMSMPLLPHRPRAVARASFSMPAPTWRCSRWRTKG